MPTILQKFIMKKICFIALIILLSCQANAQVSSTVDNTIEGKISVFKDSRLDVLAKKEAAFNESNPGAVGGVRSSKGYRLLLLSTNDRPAAMNLRTQLLQRYPDQKVYMSFQPPNIKIRFGNFVEKAAAEKIKKDIIANKLVTGNIYVLFETIEVKPDKEINK